MDDVLFIVHLHENAQIIWMKTKSNIILNNLVELNSTFITNVILSLSNFNLLLIFESGKMDEWFIGIYL